jgi:FtsP/CotA-like multicopper oxidase with cupredoxin domain
MLTEGALLGGASIAIVIDGIERLQPAVADLTEQVFVIRDQVKAGKPAPGPQVPFQDLSINWVPISYPQNVPAIIQMPAGEQQLWRVSNAGADSILDLQMQFDGVPQNLGIVAIDGVPTGSQDGTQQGQIIDSKDVMIPPGARAEFIVNAPGEGVSNASLVTLGINTGPDGDNDPQRTVANIETVDAASTKASSTRVQGDTVVPSVSGGAWKQRFANLADATPATTRKLYFSEDNPNSQFFVTVDGATPTLFDPNKPPAIVTTQGTTEDWTIENRALEVHPFHLHQIHFMVLTQNNFEVNGSAQMPYLNNQMADTVLIPFWDGNPSHPYPSITVRADFRGADIGDFVYHCHIAEHEDKGMMAIIRVEPNAMAAAFERFRLRLASVGWFGSSDPTDSLWCVRGQPAKEPLRRRRLGTRQVAALEAAVP